MPGDYAELAKLASRVSQFANGAAQKLVVKAIAAEALTQAQLGFRESRDPYGSAWAPLKYRKGKPLLLTGRLRASIAVSEVTSTGFRIGSNVAYAVYHQQGVNKTFRRKARTQVAVRRSSGKGRGQFVKLGGKKGPRRAEALHFSARDVHLVIPRRQFIPDGGRLGPIWAKAFVAAGNLAIKRILGSGSA